METSDIIKQLQKLQIEQNKLLSQLSASEAEKTKVIATQRKVKSEKTLDRKDIKVGDQVTLLTTGVRSRKGDKAKVTGIRGKTNFFTVIRNGHSTHRKTNNVRKVE